MDYLQSQRLEVAKAIEEEEEAEKVRIEQDLAHAAEPPGAHPGVAAEEGQPYQHKVPILCRALKLCGQIAMLLTSCTMLGLSAQ